MQQPHSQLTLSFSQNNDASEGGLTIIHITLHEGARLSAYAGIFGGSSSSFIQDTVLAGAGSEVEQKTLFFGAEKQVFDMFSRTILAAPNTKALVESKGVLRGQSQASFDGGIEITQMAKGADARLTEHTLLLSPQARMNAIPGLTIGTNDVKASHAAGVTRVDDEQLFFAASRGIDEATATKLIVEGFLAEMYDAQPNKKEIRTLIRKKLSL